jgi:hypothetical protein
MGENRTYNFVIPKSDFCELISQAKKHGRTPADLVRHAVKDSLYGDHTPPDEKSWSMGVEDAIAVLKQMSARANRNGYIIDRAILRIMRDTGYKGMQEYKDNIK